MLAESKVRTLPFDIWLVALEETSDWHLPPEQMSKIKSIYQVYYFDRNSHTYCCEITPSYWLEPVSREFDLKPEFDEDDRARDRLRDQIDAYLMYEPSEGQYWHVSSMDAWLERHQSQPGRMHHYGHTRISFEDVSEDDQWESLREHFQGNAYL